jgi:hypothetical protein
VLIRTGVQDLEQEQQELNTVRVRCDDRTYRYGTGGTCGGGHQSAPTYTHPPTCMPNLGGQAGRAGRVEEALGN